MTQTLIILVSIHVFSLLTAASAFYALWLSLLAKHGATRSSKLWRAGIGAVAALTAWGIAFFCLGDYFLGIGVPVTPQDVTMLIPTFVLVQNILLPLLGAASLFIFGMLWRSAPAATPSPSTASPSGVPEAERGRLLSLLIGILTGIATVSAVALAFLGVMIP